MMAAHREISQQGAFLLSIPLDSGLIDAVYYAAVIIVS